MTEKPNIKDTLFTYVKDPETWFYWYHSPERLKALYVMDHEIDPDYQEGSYKFTKKVWWFKQNTVKENVVIEKNLADFFNAVLDEIRLKKANAFAEYALYISDNEDLAYFRDRVAKREIIADIDYDQQRDHAVHTLYNYLLGWYIFEHSEKLRGTFRSYIEGKLKIDPDKQNQNLLSFYNSDTFCKVCKIKIPEPDNLIGLVHEFADVWPIASLLHDIGYILEGSLSSASPDVEHLRVTNGSKIIHDYFNHYFWKSFEIDFRVAKNIAKTLGVVVPDFRYSESLASLGDRLCDIGSCENIRKNLSKDSNFEKSPYVSLQQEYDLNCEDFSIHIQQEFGLIREAFSIQQKFGLNREAFSIWKEHYKFYDNKKMEDILYIVERVYKDMMWVGTAHGKRNLDHGVCSGLIALQALTFFHELFWGFCRNEWLSESADSTANENDFSEKQERLLMDDASNRVSKQLFTKIKNEITRVPKRIMVREEFDHNGSADRDKHCKLHADFWFKKILWATASSAIHSIIQKDEYRNECKEHLDSKEKPEHLKIGLKDDPLAFLGLLVDGLQEWDRYKVAGRGEAAFSGDEPLQNTDVTLDLICSGSIHYAMLRESVFSGTELLLQSTGIEVECIHSDIICLTYPKYGKNGAEELTKNLNKCLEKWTDIVKIVGYDR